jgi:hypothetical protein
MNIKIYVLPEEEMQKEKEGLWQEVLKKINEKEKNTPYTSYKPKEVPFGGCIAPAIEHMM